MERNARANKRWYVGLGGSIPTSLQEAFTDTLGEGRTEKVLPDVPTVAESGLAGFEMVSWYGLWGPAKLPQDVTSTLHAAVIKALKSQRVVQVLNEQGFIPKGNSPEAFSAYVHTESEKYGKLIKAANITIN